MDSVSRALPSAALPATSRTTLDRLFAASGAVRWGVSRDAFAAAIAASAAHRFGVSGGSADEIDRFVQTLHVEDLALACGCLHGSDAAWEHFVRELRPAMYAAARAQAGEAGRELADSLFAELFGVSEKGESRRSLLSYYRGRARLAVWLRTVLAQRRVDAIRATSRTTPLDEAKQDRRPSPVGATADPHREEYVVRVQRALDAGLAALEPRDRLRLRMYYGEQLAMAQIGRLLGEHEATVSRRLDRVRRQLRESVRDALQRSHGMSTEAVDECMRQAAEASELNVSAVLGDGGGGVP